MHERYIKIASVGDLDENQNKAYDVDGISVLLCQTKDAIYAVENQCSHQLQALEGGRIRGCFIFCPIHGQRFSLKDGSAIGQLTDKPIRTFRVKIDASDVLINVPLADA